LKETYKVIQHI